ncbi:DNA binding protein [Bacillus phage 010DV004]|nr:DNA binding protein [Bacillus phage 010DV004]QZA69410.1 DNA binding protein [Bacillus phage 010DV005]
MTTKFNERAALQQYLNHVLEERSRLLDIANNITNRLRELDEAENVQVPTVPVSGQEMSILDAIDKHNSLHSSNVETAKTEGKLIDIEMRRDHDNKTSSVKTKARRDVKQVARVVASILKEAGVPLSTSRIVAKLKEKGIPTNSVYALLGQIKDYDPRISKPKHGYYQYKG